MTYQFVSELLAKIISAVQNSAVASTKTVLGHTFPVMIKNVPKVQDIKGTVVVGNQKRLETQIESLTKSVKRLDRDYAVTVKNPFDKKLLSKIEDNTAKLQIQLVTVVKELISLQQTTEKTKTDEISVINQPLKELKAVLEAIQSLDLKIKGLKLNPIIKVEAPIIPKQAAPIVNVPQTKVVVEKTEYDWEDLLQQLQSAFQSKNPKAYIPVRLTDGSQFYEAMKEMMAIASGGGGSSVFRNQDGGRDQALIDDNRVQMTSKVPLNQRIVKVGAITYIAFAVPGTALNVAKWQVKKIDETDTSDVLVTWAGTGRFNQLATNLPGLTYA